MKLLITTQAVDTADSNLGFFVRWIEEFAKHSEQVTVICLRSGTYSLPKNVTVITLGRSRMARIARLLELSLSHKDTYDAVFVHMNPEYIVIAGFLWKFLGKKIALWYTHKSVDLKLRIAAVLADTIFTASKESFRLPSHKVHVMGHGIDTNFFSPDSSVSSGDWYLSVGRLMPSKDHQMAVEEARKDGKKLRIAGEGPELNNLKSYAAQVGAEVEFLGGLSQAALRDEYRKAQLLIHTSKTGSLDKVVLEALACGLHVRTRDPALKSIEQEGPVYVREHHSLSRLVPRILETI
jgi:glycosyltransferase involved in cell wall biosynthesis